MSERMQGVVIGAAIVGALWLAAPWIQAAISFVWFFIVG